MPTGRTGSAEAVRANDTDAVAMLDADGRVRELSPAAERLLGVPAAEWNGRRGVERVHEDDRAQALAAFERSRATPGVPVAREYRLEHRDGGWRHVEAIAVADRDRSILVVYRDVTDRHDAAHAIRIREERLRRLFESAADLIYHCDPHGCFTDVNPTACRVMKYERAELVGLHFLTLVHPDYRAEATAYYARQMAERLPTTYFEFPAVAKDGEIVWVGQHVQLVTDDADPGGTILGVQAIARDISRQKDAEERLRLSEARYRSLIQGAAYGIYRSGLDGTILDANPAFAEMLGYTSVDDVLSVNMRSVYLRPEERAELVARWQREGGSPHAEETRWRKLDGTPIVVRLTARLVDTGEGGGGCTFEGIAEDITARRALEEQLRQSQKMEAVGRLARGIAHDFNNVLAAILGDSDLIQLTLGPNHPSYADVQEIGKAAERGAALTRQLLAFSRRQALEPVVLDLHAVVRSFDTMLQRLSGDIELRLETPGEAPLVRMEPGQIEQIVMNLVVNARDAAADGGTIEVRADTLAVTARNAARYAGVSAGRYGRIAVHDNGAGISPEAQRHVFEPFFTTKDPAKGTGLGLSIVYGIAKEAGGTVAFSTGAGEGTTFEVLLPVAVSAAAGHSGDSARPA